LLINGKYQDAQELLDKFVNRLEGAKKKDNKEMQKKKRYQYAIHSQFVELSKASLYRAANRYDDEHIAVLQNVLDITRSNGFDINAVASTHLSYRDVLAVNQMATGLCESGKMREGLRLFEDLIKSMDNFCVDEHEKIRTYTVVLCNYSKYIGREGYHRKSIDIAVMGDEMDVKHGRLKALPTFAVNRACGMVELGDEKNCLPYFALAYHGSGLLGRQKNADVTKEYVKERLGVDF